MSRILPLFFFSFLVALPLFADEEPQDSKASFKRPKEARVEELAPKVKGDLRKLTVDKLQSRIDKVAEELEEKKKSVDDLRKKLEEQQRQLDRQQLLIEFLKDRLQQWTVQPAEESPSS